jgi:hypothetical protein
MAAGSGLPSLEGYPFAVRCSRGSENRARAACDLAADAYAYLNALFGSVQPDIAVIVANEEDWPQSTNPYGMPFFRDGEEEIRPGILVMPADTGSFWLAMAADLAETAPQRYPLLLATYPDGRGGLDLQPFFDLITVHELGHAFEVLGDLQLPTHWLSEIFVNLALHTFVATRRPGQLPTLEVLSQIGSTSTALADRIRAGGFSTLDEAQEHYPGWTDEPMTTANYIWLQYRWQRLAAEIFNAEGESALVRCWERFCGRPLGPQADITAAALAPMLETDVSPTLAAAVRGWT